MRKFAVFSTTLFTITLFAGLYGIFHDQITYSISPEYFTKFKYNQFGLEPGWFGGDRQTVAVIGFLATWWTGIFLGIGIGLTGLIFNDHQAMRKAIQTATILTFCIAVLMSVCGFFYGKYLLTEIGVNWWLPENLVDKKAYITVGSIHNFSYLGGLFGFLASIVYLIRLKRKQMNIIIETKQVAKNTI